MIDKMYWVSGEVLSLGAQLAEASNLPAPEILRRRIMTLLEEMDRRGQDAGISKQDLEDARDAIVAFIDEQLFRSPWQGRQEWMLEPLQLVCFHENTAGEGFFDRLSALERDPSRLHVVEVYYLCLALGFQGKLAVRGGDGLGPTMDRLLGDLARATPKGEVLGPHALAADSGRRRRRAEAPVLVIGAAIVALALFIAIGLKVALVSATSDATAQIRAGAPSSKPLPRTR
jgi:type VI secretion system protein ImpK